MKYKIILVTIFLICFSFCKKGVNPGAKIATVTTVSLISSTYNTYTVGGTVVDDGGATITERGICYKAGNNPTINDSKIIDTGAGKSFSATLTRLLFNTNYSYKAYAINTAGVGYGSEMTFTTGKDSTIKVVIKPTVNINQPDSITTTSCRISGYIVSNGGGLSVKKGFCYSSTSNQPGMTDSVIYNTDTSNLYTSIINGLSYSTTYYIKAFANNQAGTSFSSNVVSFKTAQPALATVLTNVVSSISFSNCITGGTIVNNGGAVISEKGICISTSPAAKITDTKIINTDTSNNYTVSINSLLPNTLYYTRAYAINAGGVAYGNEITFTTLNFNLTGNFLMKKITTSSISSTIDSTLYFYDSQGRMASYFYQGNSIYPSSDGGQNYYFYDINNNIVSDSIPSSYYKYSCTFINSGNNIDGTKIRDEYLVGGGIETYWSNHIEYINNNVSVFNYYSSYAESAPQMPYIHTTNSDSAKYTYTSYLNPEYSIKAIIVNYLTGMNSYWSTSKNMPLTENAVIKDVNGNIATVTSIYTYTMDILGRVIVQTQTKSTGEVVTTNYTYY